MVSQLSDEGHGGLLILLHKDEEPPHGYLEPEEVVELLHERGLGPKQIEICTFMDEEHVKDHHHEILTFSFGDFWAGIDESDEVTHTCSECGHEQWAQTDPIHDGDD